MNTEKLNTTEAAEFLRLLRRLQENGGPGEFMAVICVVEALAASQPDVDIREHCGYIQEATNGELKRAIKVLRRDEFRRKQFPPEKMEYIIEYIRNIIRERKETAQ